MAVDKLVDSGQLNSDLTTVANAIRAKSGGTTPLQFPNEFVTEIAAIPTGTPPTGTKTINITSNGTVTEDVSTYADAQVIANVPNTYTGADEGKVVDNGALVSQTSATYTTNNTYDTTTVSSVTVNVSGGSPTLETVTKSYTPTESQQTEQITPGTGYDGIAEVDVTVGAISSTYVGSAIPQNDSSDLSASGATVTAPSGYYASNATLTIPSGSATTPATSITANPTISVSSGGLITATTSASQSVTPTVSPGYVSSGTAGTVSVSGSKTQQLTTQGATTITPTTSSQTAVAANTYTTGAITVAAMPSGTAGTPVATKSAVNNHSLTVTPSVTNTTGYITGGTLTGTAVTVTAAELESGTKTITSNATGIDVTGYATVDVNVSGGGGGNIDAFLDGTITSVSSNVSSITIYALYGRSAIETLSFPNLTMVPGNSLQNLSSLRSFYLPEVTQIGAVGMGYTGNAPISVWVFPKLESMLQQACRGSNSMTTFDMLGNSTSGIATNVFLNNALFTTLIIRGDVRVTGLGNIAAFGGTPFASGGSGGTLYVPNSLISTYQSASNWSTILGYANNQIKSIESTHTDPTAPIDLTLYYADGTAIS